MTTTLIKVADNRNEITVRPENRLVILRRNVTSIRIADQGIQGPEGPPPEGSSIPQLTEIDTLAADDLLVIYDASASTTKYVSLADLKTYVNT